MDREKDQEKQDEDDRFSGVVTAVSVCATYGFSKAPQLFVRLIAGVGVEGDVHAGITVRHRHQVARDPTQPNLRQVHLIHEELFAELGDAGFAIAAGQLGENVTTRGIDLLSLPAGTLLSLGNEAIVEVTGLRDPCYKLNKLQPGLMKATMSRDDDGSLIRKTGVMSIVRVSGEVRPGDEVRVILPSRPYRRLECV